MVRSLRALVWRVSHCVTCVSLPLRKTSACSTSSGYSGDHRGPVSLKQAVEKRPFLSFLSSCPTVRYTVLS